MEYDLAKKLKDAGFPQTRVSGKSWAIYKTDGVASTAPELLEAPNPFAYEEIYYCPTLEELIKAVGKGGIILDTCITPNRAASLDKVAWGNTPIEAVANLWLALSAVSAPQ